MILAGTHVATHGVCSNIARVAVQLSRDRSIYSNHKVQTKAQ